MNIYRKLVQNKRKKMLIFTVLLLVLPFVSQTGAINLTYILKKHNGKPKPICLAQEVERYQGVGWIYPIPESEDDSPRLTKKILPDLSVNLFDCDFSKNNDCNMVWRVKDWQLDEDSIRIYDFIDDDRWEGLPTIFTTSATKSFDVQVPNIFSLGLTIRAKNGVKISICNGWNPDNYPCYYINIEQFTISLQKRKELKNVKNNATVELDSYEVLSKIISEDEWRNFILNFNAKGQLTLIDVTLNRTVIDYQDQEFLKPIYVMLSSEHPALWKVHQNHFLYTKVNGTYRLGPRVPLSSNNMCVSLYVSTCANCEMIFYTVNQDHTRRTLKHVGPTGESQWELIKLKQENIQDTFTDIFVQTKLRGYSVNQTGFWAIDDIRICHENEVKIIYLNYAQDKKLNKTEEDSISCQLVSRPNWRPKKLLYNDEKDFPDIEHNSTKNSILLMWKDEDPNHQMNYFVTYQGKDICEHPPYNIKRRKSNGFKSTTYNQMTLENLEPYTKYDITVSSALHDVDKKLQVTTLEEEKVTISELPGIQTQPNETYVTVFWDKIDCRNVYGHIFYSLSITNKTLNFSKELNLKTENSYIIDGLSPFTRYNLNVRVGRNEYDFQEHKTTDLSQVFTTLSGAAPSVENLEIYAIGNNIAFLRYNLPKDTRGVPSGIRVDRCNALSFKKCKSLFFDVKPCVIWPYMYCLTINNLMELQHYNFKVSLKNFNTITYGKEVVVSGYAVDKIPGTPTNITYEVVDCQEIEDYCNLNVSWLHPYYQNSTITSFHINLNSTKKNSVTKEHEIIHEVMKIFNNSYQAEYTYQIKYLPFSTSYDLTVQAINKGFKSGLARAVVKTDNIGDHIDQSPTLLSKCDSTVTFKLPSLDRRLEYYNLTVIVQDFNKGINVNLNKFPKKISDNLCHFIGDTWISKSIKITSNTSKTIVIGEADELDKITLDVDNKPLKPDTKYCFTFIVTNRYRNSDHDVMFYETAVTQSCKPESKAASSGSSHQHLYALLFLLLVVPIGLFTYW
ncbi:uncharacterized protein LOC109605342 isoform X2 [Aethina tumida]|nr:uncharacterized protein LOC109605342 isoform X2 [Aethina tumida]